MDRAPFAETPVVADFVLHPHRSLGPRGFLVVMALIGGVSFVTGMLFVLQGAWPVLGFLGLDVALVWFAFRQSYRAARERERIVVTGAEIVVMRRDAAGRESIWRLPSYFARVGQDEHPSGDHSLYLASHGRRVDVGACLGPAERKDFGDALAAALRRARQPSPRPIA